MEEGDARRMWNKVHHQSSMVGIRQVPELVTLPFVSEPTEGTHRQLDNRKEQEEVLMNARNKLNVAFVNGSLVVAALIAATFGSWLVFGIAAGALLTGNVIAGDIRLRRRK